MSEAPYRPGLRKLAILAVKLAVTAGLLAWLLSSVDTGDMVRRIGEIGPLAVIASMLVNATHIPTVAARWGLVGHAIGHPLRFGSLLRLTYVGVFFNQVLPAPVGGDAMRVWGAVRVGIPLAPATSAVLLERLWGLGTLVLFAAPLWPFLLPADSPRVALSIGSALLALSALLILLRLLRRAPQALARRLPGWISGFLDDARETAWPPDRVVLILLWSFAGHLAAIASVATLAAAMNLPIGALELLVALPVVLLSAVVPFSFAGWGVREGAMVWALGLFGVPAPDALALSISFGLVMIGLSLPGALLFQADIGGRTDR